LKDVRLVDWMLPSFSTTTDDDKIVFSVIAMGSMQAYFDFALELGCALPEVTLLGTVDDWKSIRARADKLAEFEMSDQEFMKKWRNLMCPVLDKFVETAEGSPDYAWWNQICHYRSMGSGPRYICGWVGVFNVFSQNGDWLGDKTDLWREPQKWPVINVNDMAPSYVSCPLKLIDDLVEINTEMYAGIMCADVVNENSLVPRLDWACFELAE
jgi:hypothetical protein